MVSLRNSATGTTTLATAQGKWAAILGRDGKPAVTFDPPIGYVYPLAVGQAWSTKHKATYADGTVADIVYSCKVEGREEVTVRAGTFDTLRIVCDSPDSHDVSWSIVDLGMHAKQEFNRFANHPQGAGTRRAELLAVNKRY